MHLDSVQMECFFQKKHRSAKGSAKRTSIVVLHYAFKKLHETL